MSRQLVVTQINDLHKLSDTEAAMHISTKGSAL